MATNVSMWVCAAKSGACPVMWSPVMRETRRWWLRPFALAHAAGLTRLQAAETTVDWLMITPPAGLDPSGPWLGAYRIGGEQAPPAGVSLSYADLAVAMLDEIELPRHHRTRVSIY